MCCFTCSSLLQTSFLLHSPMAILPPCPPLSYSVLQKMFTDSALRYCIDHQRSTGVCSACKLPDLAWRCSLTRLSTSVLQYILYKPHFTENLVDSIKVLFKGQTIIYSLRLCLFGHFELLWFSIFNVVMIFWILFRKFTNFFGNGVCIINIPSIMDETKNCFI